MTLITDTLPRAATILLDLILAEIDEPKPCLVGGNGLPAGAIDLDEQNLLIATTPIVPLFFGDALRRACGTTGRDTLLLRHGFDPEGMDPVEADLAIRTTGGTVLIERLSFLRDGEGGLHLVPAGPGLCATIGDHGLTISTTPPWDCPYEWSDGLIRAATEIARAFRGKSR